MLQHLGAVGSSLQSKGIISILNRAKGRQPRTQKEWTRSGRSTETGKCRETCIWINMATCVMETLYMWETGLWYLFSHKKDIQRIFEYDLWTVKVKYIREFRGFLPRINYESLTNYTCFARPTTLLGIPTLFIRFLYIHWCDWIRELLVDPFIVLSKGIWHYFLPICGLFTTTKGKITDPINKFIYIINQDKNEYIHDTSRTRCIRVLLIDTSWKVSIYVLGRIKSNSGIINVKNKCKKEYG